jgi:hypothetical protein
VFSCFFYDLDHQTRGALDQQNSAKEFEYLNVELRHSGNPTGLPIVFFLFSPPDSLPDSCDFFNPGLMRMLRALL